MTSTPPLRRSLTSRTPRSVAGNTEWQREMSLTQLHEQPRKRRASPEDAADDVKYDHDDAEDNDAKEVIDDDADEGAGNHDENGDEDEEDEEDEDDEQAVVCSS